VDYQRPDERRIRAFKTILEQEKVAVIVRYSRGLAVAAYSCIYCFPETPTISNSQIASIPARLN
jgi:hypothetical protein